LLPKLYKGSFKPGGKMGKRIIVAILFFSLLVCINSGISFASPFDALYTVDAEYSTDEKTEFTLDETPWLYIDLPDGFGINVTLSWWKAPGQSGCTSSSCFTGSGSTTDEEIWLSLSDWNSIKEIGKWTIC
jgi:hypothetical protein